MKTKQVPSKMTNDIKKMTDIIKKKKYIIESSKNKKLYSISHEKTEKQKKFNK